MAAISTYAVHAMDGLGSAAQPGLLAPIVDHLRGMRRESTPSAVFDVLGDMTTRLRTAITQHLDPTLSWLDRLRFYSCTINPLRRTLTEAEIEDRARHVSELIWPNWAIGLPAEWDRYPDLYRGALSAALLLPGAPTRNVNDLASKLGGTRQRLMRPKYF